MSEQPDQPGENVGEVQGGTEAEGLTLQERLHFLLGEWNVLGTFHSFSAIYIRTPAETPSAFPRKVASYFLPLAGWAVGAADGAAEYHLAPGNQTATGTFEARQEADLIVGSAEWYPSLLVFRATPQSRESLWAYLFRPDGDPITLRGEWRGAGVSFWNPGQTLIPKLLPELLSIREEQAGQPGTLLRYCSVNRDKWLLVVSHVVYDGEATDTIDGEAIEFVRGIFRHRPAPAPPQEADARLPRTESEGVMSSTPPDNSGTGIRSIASIEENIVELERNLEGARENLQSADNELDRCRDDIDDLEVEEHRLLVSRGAERRVGPSADDTRLREVQRDLHSHYGRLVQLEEIEELQDRIDAGYSEWEDAALRRAEEILARHAEKLPHPPEAETGDPLLSAGLARLLSEPARTMLQTYQRLIAFYRGDESMRAGDNSLVIAAMAKCCERAFSDAFAARRDALLMEPSVIKLINKFKTVKIDIPEEDQKFKVDKGSLGNVLSLVQKDKQHWSGMRKCGISLLLFGTRYQAKTDECIEIENPLRLRGTEHERRDLRLACYEFQELRNGFVHHDPASWSDVEGALACFQRCLPGLVKAFHTP